MATNMAFSSTCPEDFPVIDFSEFEQNPAEVSNELFEAACRWGFLILKGHGIPQTDVDEMFALVYTSRPTSSISLTNAQVQVILRTTQRNQSRKMDEYRSSRL